MCVWASGLMTDNFLIHTQTQKSHMTDNSYRDAAICLSEGSEVMRLHVCYLLEKAPVQQIRRPGVPDFERRVVASDGDCYSKWVYTELF